MRSSFLVRQQFYCYKLAIVFEVNLVKNQKTASMGSTYDKHLLYENSVQDPEYDVDLFKQFYSDIRATKPKTLREDFCGTFMLCRHWVADNDKHIAHGYDIGTEPVEYGKKYHLSKLSTEQKKRIHIHQKDVRTITDIKFDIITASNFSYFIFKTRNELKEYFSSVYNSLDSNGIFIMDHFGGPGNEPENIEEKDCELPSGEEFIYYWEQETLNPINHNAQFYIHFKDPNGVKINRAYSYDWRMWSIVEIREILEEVGFSKSVVYWEDDDEERFYATEEGEQDCLNWIAQIVGVK